jgi:hypothetical protein
MKKDLRVIAEIRETMNESNLQETISKLHGLVLDYDDEENYILNKFTECFKSGDMIKFEAKELENKISNRGEIKDINDLNSDYYYHECLDDESEEWVWIINNIKFDEAKRFIESILGDIEEEIKEAC